MKVIDMGNHARLSGGPKAPLPVRVSAACTFLPFLEFMIQVGAPVDRWLEECRLPFQIHEDPECYIPTRSYWSFVSLAETREGIEDLGLRVGHDHIYDVLGLPLVSSAYSAPSAIAGVERFSRGIRGIYSGMGVVLARGEKDSVKLLLQKSFDIGVSGFSQTEWLGVLSLVSLVQLFAGRTWKPEVISLRSPRVIPPLAQALYPDTHFIRGQETTHISFPKQTLSLGPSPFGAEVVERLKSESKVHELLEPPVDLSDTLVRLLATYLPDGYLSLEAAAEIVGVSSRTLQRRLAEYGIKYTSLVERTRFDVASRMLTETDASSLDIAFATGYEDPSHFARAFRRVAACSPREYRRRHASQMQH